MVDQTRARLETSAVDVGRVSLSVLDPHTAGWRYRLPDRVWLGESPTPEREPAILYTYDRHGAGSTFAGPEGRCLDAFIRLDQGPPATFGNRVVEFARRWGPLGSCRHRKPAAHYPPCRCTPLGTNPPHGRALQPWEPLEAWRRYSRQLRALLLVAARLLNGQAGDAQDWSVISSAEPGQSLEIDEYPGVVYDELTLPPPSDRVGLPALSDQAGRLQAERYEIGLALDVWLRYGAIRVEGGWWEPMVTADVWLRYGGLAGVLAVQLAAALKSPKGLFICTACRTPFTPAPGRYRPRRNQRAWCNECGRQAQWRDYQQRRYATVKQRKEGQHGTG